MPLLPNKDIDMAIRTTTKKTTPKLASEIIEEGISNEDELIEVITLKRIGLDDRTSDVGETVKIKRKHARILQDNNAIKVVI
jgi:hypothetical protein